MLGALKRQRSTVTPPAEAGAEAFVAPPPLGLGLPRAGSEAGVRPPALGIGAPRRNAPRRPTLTPVDVENLSKLNISSEEFDVGQFRPIRAEELPRENKEFVEAKIQRPIASLRDVRGRLPLIEPVESLEKQRDVSWLQFFKKGKKIGSFKSRKDRKSRKNRRARTRKGRK